VEKGVPGTGEPRYVTTGHFSNLFVSTPIRRVWEKAILEFFLTVSESQA
jgi:hypothetical protein